MTETIIPSEGPPSQGQHFRAERSFHPTVFAPDLREAERSYERLFGVASFEAETHGHENEPAGYRNDYESCTVIRDVWFATIAPQLCIIDGFQRLPTVDAPEINGFGWYVDDVDAAFEECRRQGLRLVTQNLVPIEGDQVPHFGPYRLFWTAADATGLRYALFQETQLAVDPRTADGWVLAPVSAEDPLGIILSSHHTILTSKPERALRFVVDILGGTVIHEGRNELLGAASTYVQLADAVVEYAVPDAGTTARHAWARNIPNDTFYAITWQVQDLKRAEHHLHAQGVQIQTRSADGFVTDPSTSLLRWGFTESLTPGDPRQDKSRRLMAA